MRLVACQSCHVQYDVTDVVEKSFPCRCGEEVDATPVAGVDAKIHRCGSCGAQLRSDAESCAYCGSEVIRDDAKLSLICPECHSRNCEASRFCTACGVGFNPEAVKVEGYELPCPVCGCLMPPRQIGGIGINECGSCNGLWAPKDRFDLLINRALEARKSADPAKLRAFEPRVKGANPASQSVAYRKCPECEAFMGRRNFQKTSGVIIDVCNQHGTWLDADELEQITGFLMTGGRPEAAKIMEEAEDAARAAQRSAMMAAAGLPERTGMGSMMTSRGFRSSRDDGGVVGSILGVLSSLLD